MRRAAIVSFFNIVAAASFVAAATGCSGTITAEVPKAQVDVSGGGVSANVGTPTVGVSVATPTVGVVVGTPQPTPVVVTSVVGPATPVAPASASFADPLIQAMAVVDARGFQPDGSAFAAQFQQGQTHEQTFNAVPGKCYVVFGVGQGITQLDIIASTVSPSPMIPSVTVATSNTTGPQAAIGGGGACVKYPLPIGGPFKITLRATSGSGIAVGRVFSR